MRPISVVAILLALLLITAGCIMPWQEDVEPRQEMRELVVSISATARKVDPGFLVVIQNGQELATANGKPGGALAQGFMAAIDGVGREELFYGYGGMDLPTPLPEHQAMAAFLDLYSANGKTVMVTDYCSQKGFVWDAITSADERGYISFCADSRELDRVPAYPVEPWEVNLDDIITLDQAHNFLYLINPGCFTFKDAYLDALRRSRHDVLVIDAFWNGTALTSDEVASLKVKYGGGQRLVLAYMSIGEAEDYRYYWKEGWDDDPPDWLGRENPQWEGNYRVDYWDDEWKRLLYRKEGSYLRTILASWFDGVYLDKVDAFEDFE